MIWKPSKGACLRSLSGMWDFPPGRLEPQSDHAVCQIGLLMEGLGRGGTLSRGIGAVSEKVVKWQQAGFVRPQKRGVGTLRPPWTPLCSQIPRVDGRSKDQDARSKGPNRKIPDMVFANTLEICFSLARRPTASFRAHNVRIAQLSLDSARPTRPNGVTIAVHACLRTDSNSTVNMRRNKFNLDN